MRTLQDMGLEIWDQLEDPYDHVQLANDLAKINAHDHTPGRGVRLTTESIEKESITEPLIAASLLSKLGIVKFYNKGTIETLGTLETMAGVSTAEWTVKSFTAKEKIKTSFKAIKAFVILPAWGSAIGYAGIVSFTGGEVEYELRVGSSGAEFAAGTKINSYFIVVGEP